MTWVVGASFEGLRMTVGLRMELAFGNQKTSISERNYFIENGRVELSAWERKGTSNRLASVYKGGVSIKYNF